MRIRVSDVMISMACHRTHARVITSMLEILWRVTINKPGSVPLALLLFKGQGSGHTTVEFPIIAEVYNCA